MSDCCSGSSCEIEPRASCPECGEKAQAVPRVTLESLLTEQACERLAGGDYLFCTTPTCPVVYFPAESGPVFAKHDLRVRVGFKETEPPIPVCYCFDYTRERIFAEVEATGESTALPFITAKVKAGKCRCEYENPSGRCCLGEVKKTVKEARSVLAV